MGSLIRTAISLNIKASQQKNSQILTMKMIVDAVIQRLDSLSVMRKYMNQSLHSMAMRLISVTRRPITNGQKKAHQLAGLFIYFKKRLCVFFLLL